MSSPVSTVEAPKITIAIRQPGGAYENLSNWTGLTIEKTLDSAGDGFSFSVPFNPTPENIRRFRPFGEQVVRVFADGQEFIRGYLEKVGAGLSENDSRLEIQGRSISAVLVDWSAGFIYDPSKSITGRKGGPTYDPNRSGIKIEAATVSDVATEYQFQGLTFNQIADRVSGPYYVYAITDTPTFPDVAIEPGQSVYDFLSSLAAANGLWSRPAPNGNLEFLTIQQSAPVADIVEGVSPIRSIVTDHDLTKRYRGYLAIAQEDGNGDIQSSAEDKSIDVYIRGIKIVEPRQKSANYVNAAKFTRARALIDSYTVQITVAGWTYGGSFWNPGQTVRVYAPSAMIMRYAPLIIKRASFTLDESAGQQTTLDLTFPEAYENRLPEVLPWEE